MLQAADCFEIKTFDVLGEATIYTYVMDDGDDDDRNC